MKTLKGILVAAGLALAVGTVATTADAQPRDRYDHAGYNHGNHHDRYNRGHDDRRNWGRHHRRCHTEYRHHRRVTRCR